MIGVISALRAMATPDQSDFDSGEIMPLFPLAAFDVVAIVASLGGMAAMQQIVSELPADFPAAIVLLQHLYFKSPLLLAGILNQYTTLTVQFAAAGKMIQAGQIYVAPPDRHLLIQSDGRIILEQTEKVNFARPSADRLLESLAHSFHHRAIAVVLTGRGVDGAHGIEQINQLGGRTIAQDKDTSACFEMPHAAIKTMAIDRVLPLSQIASTLVTLVQTGELPL